VLLARDGPQARAGAATEDHGGDLRIRHSVAPVLIDKTTHAPAHRSDRRRSGYALEFRGVNTSRRHIAALPGKELTGCQNYNP
jgi:hypothetical protein